jgi:ParB family chromosome partitioning protein
MKRKALGKGIEAIIANKPSPLVIEKGFKDIDVDSIFPNPNQPRKKFNTQKIKELADSIKESGLIQPVVVYKDKEDSKYYLMVGERRWRAVQLLNWKKIPAVIRNKSKDDVLISALVENIQREDLNAIEVAEGLELLIQDMGLTQEKASQRLGMSRTSITNYLRLLKLPEAVKQSLISGSISQGHARALLSLEGNAEIITGLSRILGKHLSVRQTENMVKNFYTVKSTKKVDDDPNLRKIEEKLSRMFSTKVKVKYSKKGEGKIELYFHQLEEFERLYKLLFKE